MHCESRAALGLKGAGLLQIGNGAKADIYSVATHPSSPHLFATATDGSVVRVWDADRQEMARATAVGFACRWPPLPACSGRPPFRRGLPLRNCRRHAAFSCIARSAPPMTDPPIWPTLGWLKPSRLMLGWPISPWRSGPAAEICESGSPSWSSAPDN